MTMGFEQLDAAEAKLCHQMALCLANYKVNHAPSVQNEFFKEVEQLLLKFNDCHQARAQAIKQGVTILWVKQLGTQAALKATRTVTAEYLTQEYQFFLQTALDITSMHEDDVFSIHALIFKIMSRPVGQRLILNLNRLSRLHNATIQVNYGDYLSVKLIGDSGAGLCVDSGKLNVVDEESQWNETLYRKQYKQYETKGQALKAIVLTYPKNFFDRPLTFCAGIEVPLVCLVPFISFAHELIHVMHYFRGKNRAKLKTQHDIQSPLYHLYRHSAFFALPEEFWSIELGKLSENALREEHDLPKRGSYCGAEKAGLQFFERLKMIVMLGAKRQSQETLGEAERMLALTY